MIYSRIITPTQLYGKNQMTAFETLKESLMNPPALGHPNYQIPFFPFLYMKRKRMPLGFSPQYTGTTIEYYSQKLDPEAWGYPCSFRTIMATALLVKTTEKIIVGSPFNHFCTSCSKSSPKFSSCSTFFSCLTS